jgi:phage-related protein
MPKLLVRLEFYSDDMVPVQILGIVEDVSINPFSKDPEFKVSLICPDPYFQAIEPTIYTGQNGSVRTFEYGGNIEAGIVVKVTSVSGPAPTRIDIQLGDPKVVYFGVEATVSATKYFEISSIPMRKYVQNIDLSTGVIDNLLSNVYIQEGALWPTLQPGENEFQIITDDGVQDYLLIFYERFGGL